MIPDEIRKLLGGYATGTLTDEERNLLFSAALEDQELFDTLADEETLRELLAEPDTRRALLEQLRQQPVLTGHKPWEARIPPEFAIAAPPPVSASESSHARRWNQLTPGRLAMAGGLAIVLLAVGGLQYRKLQAPAPAELALNRAPQVSAAAPRQATPSAPSVAVVKEAPRLKETDAPAAQNKDRQLADELRSDQSRVSTVEAERKVAKEEPTPPAAAGGLRSAAAPPAPAASSSLRFLRDRFGELDARVSDVNGTIVSINAGANAGLKAGDTVEIVRDGRVIATVKLTEAGATFAVGPFQASPGSTTAPRTGDTVRHK